ncbi:MAG: Type 1 glutamine amidotransferase-like domain-containing protein [Candidatus Shapirobacteria bacterium]|jgi:dipeptidase E
MNKSVNTLLFLAGGGNKKDSLKIDTSFVKSLKNKKIVYIPLALEPSINGYESCFDWISSTISDRLTGEFVDISMWTDLNNKKESDLNNFDAIYIGGGNTYNLLKKIKETKFDQILINFYKNGGVVYGGSAGAIICGYNIATVSEENKISYSNSHGLNLVNDYSILCHYTKDQENKVFKYIKENKMPVIGIPEKSGLIIKNGHIGSVVGYEPIYIFNIDCSVKIVNFDENISI